MLLLALLACGRPVEAEGGCLDDVRRVSPGAAPLGFSARDVLAGVEGVHEASAEWDDDGATEVTIGLTYDGGRVSLHDLEPGEDAVGLCEDWLEVPVAATFSTGDGAFDEALDGTLRATAADVVFLRAVLDPDVAGTWENDLLDPAEWDRLELDLASAFPDAGPAGDLRLMGEREAEAADDDGTEEVRIIPVLRWPG